MNPKEVKDIFTSNGLTDEMISLQDAITTFKEILQEKRREKVIAANAWGCNKEHQERTLEYLKQFEVDELLSELQFFKESLR